MVCSLKNNLTVNGIYWSGTGIFIELDASSAIKHETENNLLNLLKIKRCCFGLLPFILPTWWFCHFCMTSVELFYF